MQARTLLALMAVAELLAICLNFTLAAYVIVLTLPFAMLALVGVFLAIYCGWRTGIWIFVGANTVLILYNVVMLWIISGRGGFSQHPLDMSWNIIQLSCEVLCVALAMWVLVELSFEDKDKKKDDSDERKPLFSRH